MKNAWGRRLALLQILMNRGGITTRVAAECGETTRKIALVDLKALSAHGVPLSQRGRGGEQRWVLEPSWREVGLEVGLAERLAMLFGRDLVQAFLRDTQLGDPLERMRRRLRLLDPSADVDDSALRRRFYYVHEPTKDYSSQSQELSALISAVVEPHRVSLTHIHPRSHVLEVFQRARPVTLATYKRGLYLFLLVSEPRSDGPGRVDAVRRLAVEQLREVESHSDQPFEYPPEAEYHPERVLRQTFGVRARAEQEPEFVRISFSGDVRSYVERRRWLPGGCDEEVIPLPDGGCELCFKGTGAELVSLVLSFGCKAEVLEPAWLRDEVAAELRQAVGRYG